MNKYLKWSLIIAALVAAALYIAYLILIAQTKKHSPEETVNFQEGNYNIEVFYNRPYKKGRDIFGSLVPFDKVWRTGANEATTFETSTDLTINGKTLEAGKYTLWTIPGAESWSVIFNSKQYSWGVNGSGVSKEAEFDALTVKVPVQALSSVTEQFTITLENQGGNPALAFTWDKTKASVLMK